MGCNSVCSYCIVPAVRGKEISRRPGEILAEIEQLAREGVREVTLLGQNVNSYGRDVGSGFAELLRAVDGVEGIDRIRFTSPHPKDFRRDVIDCDVRVRRRLRARASAAPVRLDANPQGDAAHVLARPLSHARRRTA